MFDTSIYQQGRGLRSGLQTGAAIGGMISDYNANNAVKEAALQIQNGANREQVIQGLMAQDPKAAQSLMNMLGGGQALQQNDQSLERGVQEIQELTQKVGMQSMQSAAMPLFGALFANDDKSRNSLIAEAANVFVKSSPATAEMILGIKYLPDEQKAGALSGIVKTLRQSGIFPDDPSTMNSQPADVAKFEYWKQLNPSATEEEQRAAYERIINPYERSFASGMGAGQARIATELGLNPVIGAREAGKIQATEQTATGQAKLTQQQQAIEKNQQGISDAETQKQKAMQASKEALSLTRSLADNPKLGSVTGVSAMTPTFNPESQDIINQANQLLALLTADNLKLMSGVLSETDIKMLRDLSSGLNVSEKGIKGSEQAVRARLSDIAQKLEMSIGGKQAPSQQQSNVVDWGSM